MNPLVQGIHFLVGQLFDIYILVMLLRFVLQLVRADFYNPICQFVVKATNPLVIPLRRYVPGLGGMDVASLVWVALLIVIELFLLTLLAGQAFYISGLGMFTFVSFLNRIWWLFMICIIIQVVVSWINPGSYNPTMSPIQSITEPVLRPARQLIPPMGGIDFSPMAVALFFGFLKIVLLVPLSNFARSFNGGFNPLY